MTADHGINGVLNMSIPRTTTGIVDRFDKRSGVVYVHESATQKAGFISNTTPILGVHTISAGMVLSLDVEDQGNVIVVASARSINP